MKSPEHSPPRAGNLEDAEAVFNLAQELNSTALATKAFSVENMDSYRNVIVRLSLCARGLISPMCALMGGVVAQEVLKAASGIPFFLFVRSFCILSSLPQVNSCPFDSGCIMT